MGDVNKPLLLGLSIEQYEGRIKTLEQQLAAANARIAKLQHIELQRFELLTSINKALAVKGRNVTQRLQEMREYLENGKAMADRSKTLMVVGEPPAPNAKEETRA